MEISASGAKLIWAVATLDINAMGIVLRLGHDDTLKRAPAPAESTMREFH